MRCRILRDREQETWERTAWATACLVNLWITEPITPKELLYGRASPTLDSVLDPEHALDALVKRAAEQNAKGHG